MADAGTVRNRAKLEGTVANARGWLAIREAQSFDSFLWQFTDGKTKINRWRSIGELPAE